jgi:hypothetical protein
MYRFGRPTPTNLSCAEELIVHSGFYEGRVFQVSGFRCRFYLRNRFHHDRGSDEKLPVSAEIFSRGLLKPVDRCERMLA